MSTLSRAASLHAQARESVWREALAYLEGAMDVVGTIKADSENGDRGKAGAMLNALQAEAQKIRQLLGEPEATPIRTPEGIVGSEDEAA